MFGCMNIQFWKMLNAIGFYVYKKDRQKNKKVEDIYDNNGYLMLCIPVSPATMELENEKLFFKSDVATTNIRTKIIQPSQSATLASSFESCNERNCLYW